jgi:putative flippase GtrA
VLKKIFNKETVLYLVFGVLTTVVNYGVFYIFYETIALGSLVANLIAFVVAVVFSFITNKLFVFDSKSWQAKILLPEATQFVGARIVTFLLEEAGLFVCDDLLNLARFEIINIFDVSVDGVMFAKILLAFIVVIINYVVCKLLVFRGKK